jgi:thioredoxin-disulfide reductase
MYDIAIIGAGPAGMTAAIYARRANKTVLIIEAKTYGGQIVNALDIENYPTAEHISGFDFATKMYEQVKKMDAEVVFTTAKKINNLGVVKEIVTDDGTYTAKTVIIATGLENRPLGLGEEKMIGRGISYCATCDGAFYKGKTVAVVGGGNTALSDVLVLADLAEKVYLIHRRTEFRGEAKLVEQVKNRANVELVLDSEVEKLEGEKRLEAVEVKNKNDEVRRILVDGLFVAVGQMPKNENFADVIEVDEAGYILADESCETNVAGIFVAGDNRKKEVRQLVTATSDGAVAALKAVQYLSE